MNGDGRLNADTPYPYTPPPILCRHCGGQIRQVEVVDFTQAARRVRQWVHVTPVNLNSSALCPRMYAAPAVAE